MPNARTTELFFSRITFFALIAFLLLVTVSNSISATITRTFTGDAVPNYLSTGRELIIANSDSLMLNGRKLQIDIDYNYDRTYRQFDLSELKLTAADTLVVTYKTAPGWLSHSFGQPIPELASFTSSGGPSLSPPIVPKRLQSTSFSELNISGAKTFRVTTQSSGTSDFGQSLDLNIEGKLTEDLKISGAISDRGYNPSYGTSNSRLEELDKVNLRLESNSFRAQIGDIVMGQRLYQQSYSEKKISGAAVNVGSGNLNFNGVVARPKGRFTSVSLTGTDGVQGPYQLSDNGQAGGVVPNSEEVWLDGIRLLRGADADYTMDYPTGRITFSVKHLIDRRSRIEIDFEPISTDYETELLSTGSNYQAGDSTIYAAIEWYREGDVSGQPKLGEFSAADQILLESAGDNDSLAYRSSAVLDSAGNYIINPDSLPDTLYQYVGNNSGTHNVTFSYAGANKGDYKFAGGDQYYYAGKNKGDYLPIIRLPLPKRTEYYTSKFGIRNEVVGQVQAELMLSQFDRNLASSLDDYDNRGMLVNLNTQKQFSVNELENSYSFRLRLKEADFISQSRINNADFNRQYLTPFNTVFNSDEKLIEAGSKLSPLTNLKFYPSFGKLEYQNQFNSDRLGLGAEFGEKEKFNANLSWSEISSDLTDSTNASGQATTWQANVSVPITKSIKLSNSFENDRRQFDYFSNNQGLKYNRNEISIEQSHEKIAYEIYVEDSLVTNWSRSLTRNRVGGSSNRRFGNLNYTAYLGYQWLDYRDFDERSFLGRTNFQYNDSRKQLSISSGYTLSEETRNARGITYLEVEPGQGNYIYENGRYIPEPNGNFIQVEELLSDQSRVSRGEKSFQLSKNWKVAQFRFNSDIREELLEQGNRDIWWLVPFLSDKDQPYLVYNRNYNGDFKVAPIKGGHAVNLSFDERIEIRNLAGSAQTRRDRNATLRLKQVINDYFIEQQLKLFQSERDSYYLGSGDIDGYKIGALVKRPVNNSEYSFGGAYRFAESALNEISQTISVETGARIRLIEKGDWRTAVELYAQKLENTGEFPSFQLTDNKPGTRGAIWSTGFNYNVRQGMRINFNLSGRHSNESTARLYGRTEVVAEF